MIANPDDHLSLQEKNVFDGFMFDTYDLKNVSVFFGAHRETDSKKGNGNADTHIVSGYLSDQNKRMSKSLEPLNTSAMWEKSTEEVVLNKGEKGLGFSILDYQVRFT